MDFIAPGVTKESDVTEQLSLTFIFSSAKVVIFFVALSL